MKKKENNNLTIEIKNSNYKDLGDIFEKIDEFDTIFGTISPKMRALMSPKGNNLLGEEKVAGAENTLDPPAVPLNRNSFGMNKSEIVVQMNKIVVGDNKNGANIDKDAENEDEDPFGSSPQSDQLPDDHEIDGMFGAPQNEDTNMNAITNL